MDVLSLYQNDFQYNFRETERSLNVVNHWYNPRVRYAYEDLPADSPCLRLIAERLVVRRILGIESLDSDYINKVSRVEVFGEGSPIYSELMLPNVFVAMALVPLSPCIDGGRPCLARLYCVEGLATRHKLSLEGMEESSLQGFSWFLEGVPRKSREEGITGRSWLLAAHLLAQVVKRKDKKTAKNLAKNFIVTGDVQNGQDICKVEMGRKEELAKQKHFNNFKWVIPKENDMNIHKRKVEKPETLEEAYKLIESMRNTATKSFFRFLREGNLEGVKEQYEIGADLFGSEPQTKLTCLEVIAEVKAKLYAPVDKQLNSKIIFIEGEAQSSQEKSETRELVNIEVYKNEIKNKMDALIEVERWLRLHGADSAMMYFLLAVNGDEEGIERNSDKYPINTCDERGLTAVDLALIEGEYDAAKLLHRFGGAPNSRWEKNPLLRDMIKTLCGEWYDEFCCLSDQESAFIAKAIDVGLAPEITVKVKDRRPGYPYMECSLFAIAIAEAKYDIVEACLKQGVDVNKELIFLNDSTIVPFTGEVIEDVESVLPWDKVKRFPSCDKFRNLFLKYGANIPEENQDSTGK